MIEKNRQVMSIYNHLEEMRKKLIICLITVAMTTVIVYVFQLDNLMQIITAPLDNLGFTPVIIGVTEGFFVRLKAAVFGGFLLSLPVVLFQIFRFIFPALFPQEKRIVSALVVSGVLLFACGIVFSYNFILDLALKLMLVDFAGGLTPMVSFSKYLSFVILILLPFGLVFEIPVIILALTRIGLISPDLLKKNRKMVVIGIFIIAAFLTPPDIISQLCLALPMLTLYEISIILSWLVVRGRKKNKQLKKTE